MTAAYNIRWREANTPYSPNPDLSLEEIAATVEKAMMNWNGEAAACSYFQLLADPPSRGEAGYDGKNVIKFRTESPNTAQAANSAMAFVVCVIANSAATWLAIASVLASL